VPIDASPEAPSTAPNMKRLPLSPRDPAPASPGVWHWIPAVATLRTYKRDWFAKDVFAGIVLTA